MKTVFLLVLSFFSLFLLSSSVFATYGEECLSEGCNDEEVRELYASYQEECINEGCSHEEVIELAGGAQFVDAMLSEFNRRGWKTLPGSPGSGCTATGTKTKCAALVFLCQDWYFCPGGTDACSPDDIFCPGGNTSSSWYACGVCLGFSGC
jgi:hypothetical protein